GHQAAAQEGPGRRTMISLQTTTAPTSSAAEVMTDYLAGAKRGDWGAAFRDFAEDLTVHIPGESAFAGDHRGRDAAIEYINAIRNPFMNREIALDGDEMLG